MMLLRYFNNSLLYIKFFRKAMPLCENDGIYVRDTQSGAVSIYFGEMMILEITNNYCVQSPLVGTLSYGATIISTESL